MLGERTAEHMAHFKDGAEAVFFEGVDEMIAKVRYYLAHEEERHRIALAGRERCVRSGYSYDERMAEILRELETNAPALATLSPA